MKHVQVALLLIVGALSGATVMRVWQSTRPTPAPPASLAEPAPQLAAQIPSLPPPPADLTALAPAAPVVKPKATRRPVTVKKPRKPATNVARKQLPGDFLPAWLVRWARDLDGDDPFQKSAMPAGTPFFLGVIIVNDSSPFPKFRIAAAGGQKMATPSCVLDGLAHASQ